jgi:hypothetical protein
MAKRRTLNRRGLIDPHDPTSWPPLLRLADIVRSADWPGLVPLTAAGWRAAAADGRIEPPIRFGTRTLVWRREYVLEVQRRGIPPAQRPKSGLLEGFGAEPGDQSGEEPGAAQASALGEAGGEI